MERKNYLVEKLSKKEKTYLEKIVTSARNMYYRKNCDYITNETSELNEEIGESEDLIFDAVFEKCQKELKSAEKFQETLQNSILYKYVKALSLRERTVLFYLFWEKKKINEIASIMGVNRKTVGRIRDRGIEKLAKNMIGGNDNV